METEDEAENGSRKDKKHHWQEEVPTLQQGLPFGTTDPGIQALIMLD
jgi:hypothetical protein